jgi:hypothetical protein
VVEMSGWESLEPTRYSATALSMHRHEV